MNKNKGFTLIEIITVLVILTVLVLTVSPIIINRVNSSREKTYKLQISNIKKAAEDWAASPKHISSIPENDGEVLTLNLADLKIGGYLDIDIKNPITNKSFPNDMLITITKKGNQYDIVVIENSGTDIEEDNIIISESPTIFLTGSYLTYVELNGKYEELWGNAYSHDGTDLSEDISREILKDDVQKANVDTSQIGTYKIYYIVVDPNNGFRNSAIRTVVIRDTTAPIINLEETTTITSLQASNYNLMSGVSASDNSGEHINVTYTGSIRTTPGSYIITYTAKDSNNNTAVRKRIIKVQ